MKILARFAISLVGIVTAMLAVLYFANKKHVDAFPTLPSAYYAKEFCTCAFVLQQDEAFCHDYARIDFPKQLADPFAGWTWNPEQKTVTVSAMGNTTRASYIGGRQGCRID